MALGRPKAVLIPYPVKGVHRGSAAAMQPELTTHDLRNVRALHSGDRIGGGKRPGTSKAFTTQLGSAALGRRLTGLGGFTEGAAVPTFSSGGAVEVEDDYTLLAGAYPSAPSDYLVSAARFDGATEVSGEADIGTAQTVGLPSAALAMGYTSGASSNRRYFAAFSRYATTNDITATFIAQPTADLATTSQVSVHGLGLMVAMSGNLMVGIGCRLFRGTSDTEALFQIIEILSDGSASVIDSTALTLSGTATWSDNLVMHLVLDSAGEVTATVHWDDEYNGGAGDAGWNPAAPTELTALASAFAVDHTQNVRAGFGCISSVAFTAGAERRFVASAAWTAQVPADPVVTLAMRPGDASPGNRYFVPDGLRSVRLDTAGNDLDGDITGPQTSATLSGDFNIVPVVDDTDNELEFTEVGTGSDRVSVVVATVEPEAKLGVALALMPTTSCRLPYFCTRVSDDCLSGIFMRGSGAQEQSASQLAMRSHGLGSYFMDYVVAGASVETTTVNIDSRTPFRVDDLVVFRDDGTEIVVSVNGMDVYSITLDPVAAAQVPDTNRTGFTIGAFSGGSSDSAGGATFIELNVATTVNVADIDSRVVAFTRERAYTGTLDSGVMTELTGQAFDNPLVQTAGFGGKLYGVDGTRSKIVNVAVGTITDWASAVLSSGAGTLPAAARLVATYRGAIYLARFASNARMWSKSRTLDPLDWDLNAAPLSTAPYDGTNGAIGQPSDDITALVPWLDDYLLFGCGTSIWVMEGDPGFRGQIINLSLQTGIAGARAYCFDHSGRLYLLGASGLYRIDGMPGKPQNISGTRLRGLLDRVDLDNTLVQMGYNDFRKEVTIYLTPVDSSQAGVHVVYNVDTDSFELDEFPADFGPTAVLSVTGVTDQRRNIIIGGWDGYLRWSDDTRADDDGEPITAYFDSAPIQPFGNQVESRASEINAELFAGSGAVTWEWFTADSADEVRTKTTDPEETGTWGGLESDGVTANAGFQEPVGISARGGAHKLRVTQTSDTAGFAMEGVVAHIEPSSRRH